NRHDELVGERNSPGWWRTGHDHPGQRCAGCRRDRGRRGRERIAMSWLRRYRWWLIVGVALTASATVAMASSLSLSSANLTTFRTCVVSGFPTTSTAVLDTK